MKSPLWIVNSILALLLLITIAFIIISFKSIYEKPAVVPLKIPTKAAALKKEEGKPKDMRLIYEENDLFGTYRPAITPVKTVDAVPMLPRPPLPRPIKPRMKPITTFLEPLPIKITGIIASNNEAKSQVTIMHSGSKKTESYRVGDKILDAFVIRIFPRKILLIRSNGQQESVYLYPAETLVDTTIQKDCTWTDVVQKQTDVTYLVNPTTFIERIRSLANLFEMFDLTTAFKGGHALGVRVGNMDSTSIGFALGFMPGDVITKVQNVQPTSTVNRMKIYNELSTLDMGADVTVSFMRAGMPLSHTYTLFNLAEPSLIFEFKPSQLSASPLAPETTEPRAMAGIPPTKTPIAPLPESTVPAIVTPKVPESVKPPTGATASTTQKIVPAGPTSAQTVAAPIPAITAPTPATTAKEPIQAMQKNDSDAMKQFGSKTAVPTPPKA